MTRPFVELSTVEAASFALTDEHPTLETDAHSHARHQILFASAGTLRLEVEGSLWLLPPQRAAWLSAGTVHITRAARPVSLRTLYLDASLPGLPQMDCAVFQVSPLARQMILHSMQWGPHHDHGAGLAAEFFALLGKLCTTWVENGAPARLPRGGSEELQRAMDYALEHLDGPLTLEEGARAAALSPRTLTRRFAQEVQSSWRSFVSQARQIRAMELLADPGLTITEISMEVGFESMGAFSQAFKRHTGQTPSAYRRSLMEW